MHFLFTHVIKHFFRCTAFYLCELNPTISYVLWNFNYKVLILLPSCITFWKIDGYMFRWHECLPWGFSRDALTSHMYIYTHGPFQREHFLPPSLKSPSNDYVTTTISSRNSDDHFKWFSRVRNFPKRSYSLWHLRIVFVMAT